MGTRTRAGLLGAALVLVGPAMAQSDDPTAAPPQVAAPKPATPKPTRHRPPAASEDDFVTFTNAPFPYRGEIPEQGVPFLSEGPDGRFYHDAPRGGRLDEADTYSDRRSLLFIPPGFDPHRPGAALILFLHGNLATLRDIKDRQGVPRQLIASHMNAALVAPQLAVDANDSSAGRFWQSGFLNTYLAEAADKLAQRSKGRFAAADIDRLPVVLVAYSGGYLATAFSLHHSAAESRIRGVVLLDALFGEEQKFADWLGAHHGSTIFVDAYSKASEPLSAQLRASLQAENVAIQTSLPERLVPGDVVFVPALAAGHNDFVTQAWTKDPLAAVLRRISLDPDAAAAPLAVVNAAAAVPRKPKPKPKPRRTKHSDTPPTPPPPAPPAPPAQSE